MQAAGHRQTCNHVKKTPGRRNEEEIWQLTSTLEMSADGDVFEGMPLPRLQRALERTERNIYWRNNCYKPISKANT